MSAVAAEPRFHQLVVDVASGEADELGYALMEVGADGVELRDETTLARGPGPGRVRLVASFPGREDAARAREELVGGYPQHDWQLGEIVGDAWRDAYKEHFKPFALTPGLTVAPPWVDQVDAGGGQIVWMDPGRAFGTGLHATTALVAAELERRRAELRDQEVLDVGTGSGILAIAALLLGAREALAIDADPEVIEVARENAARNALGERIEVTTEPLASVQRTFAVVLANIRSETLAAMAPDLRRVVRSGGLLVLSGVLAGERDELLARFTAGGFAHLDTRSRGDGDDAWVAIALRRVEG